MARTRKRVSVNRKGYTKGGVYAMPRNYPRAYEPQAAATQIKRAVTRARVGESIRGAAMSETSLYIAGYSAGLAGTVAISQGVRIHEKKKRQAIARRAAATRAKNRALASQRQAKTARSQAIQRTAASNRAVVASRNPRTTGGQGGKRKGSPKRGAHGKFAGWQSY
jgi:hypothetical protein